MTILDVVVGAIVPIGADRIVAGLSAAPKAGSATRRATEGLALTISSACRERRMRAASGRSAASD